LPLIASGWCCLFPMPEHFILILIASRRKEIRRSLIRHRGVWKSSRRRAKILMCLFLWGLFFMVVRQIVPLPLLARGEVFRGRVKTSWPSGAQFYWDSSEFSAAAKRISRGSFTPMTLWKNCC
jgi:hypothetical protein